MAKKTARPSAGTAQGRNTREEQWRRRVAAQSQRSTQMTAAAGGDYLDDNGAGTSTSTMAATTAGSVMRTGASQTQRIAPTSSMPAAPRRAPGTSAMANRTTRTRMVANALSLDDEMGYIRGDIRRLVILTAICLAIIIILAFIVR